MTKNLEQAVDEPVEGIVTARKCECCGHHEIGVTTDSGEYVPFKPGMKVKLQSSES